jgi:hypothetical protein
MTHISTQSHAEWGASWGYLRDNAKPIREIDVWDLRKVREFVPLTVREQRKQARAHAFPEVVTVSPPEPTPDPPARLDCNRRMTMGREVAKACGRRGPMVAEALPKPPAPNYVPPKVDVDPFEVASRKAKLEAARRKMAKLTPATTEVMKWLALCSDVRS